jgi:hypothetical protein
MATMIPDLNLEQIVNDGERVFYLAARKLPEEYTIFYSYRYYEVLDEERVREADFIIVHQTAGFVVVEVKEGDVAYTRGQWHEFKSGGYLPMYKDPVEQARTAMFKLRDQYREVTGQEFPSKYRFALCFPETRTISGQLPRDLKLESVWSSEHLANLPITISRLLGLEALIKGITNPAITQLNKTRMYRRNANFDVVIIDEGQDFQELWLLCLETMLKKDGELYIFADPNQDLFNGGLEELRNRYNISKHKLTYNLRNADTINTWLSPYSGNTTIRSKLTNGVPVTHISYENQQEEKRAIEKEIGRLVSQGLPLNRITILSPYRLEKGCFQGVTRIKEWQIIDFKTKGHGIRYATIRSFKGLEADVVFLIDIKASKACTPADVYVVLHGRDTCCMCFIMRVGQTGN